MKKTYNQPTCLVVELRGRDALLTSLSAQNTGLDGTSDGGLTSTNSIGSADVKGVTDVNLWDNEW